MIRIELDNPRVKEVVFENSKQDQFSIKINEGVIDDIIYIGGPVVVTSGEKKSENHTLTSKEETKIIRDMINKAHEVFGNMRNPDQPEVSDDVEQKFEQKTDIMTTEDNKLSMYLDANRFINAIKKMDDEEAAELMRFMLGKGLREILGKLSETPTSEDEDKEKQTNS